MGAPALEDGGGEPPGKVRARYTASELRGVAVPVAVLFALLAVIAVGLGFIGGPGSSPSTLEDVDLRGSFELDGDWDPQPSGGSNSSWSTDVVLLEGDRLRLEYTSQGPPGGIQVRLHIPVFRIGADGSGPRGEVLASQLGPEGTLEFSSRQDMACRLSFVHPGAFRAPGEGEGGPVHLDVSVEFHLVVHRAMST